MIHRFKAAVAAFSNPSLVKTTKKNFRSLQNRISALESLSRIDGSLASALDEMDTGFKKKPNRWERISKIADQALAQGGVASGVMLEIGGRRNPRNQHFSNFKYFALDLKESTNNGVQVEIGDITDCPHIPDNTYDFVFSVDVFEHINKPWLAGKEITRILKPGGLTVHSTLFAWRYHPCPGDYFRYTPEGLAGLFPDLDLIHKSFDYTERRRNMIGTGSSEVKQDVIGGWRENVRVNYAGKKPS